MNAPLQVFGAFGSRGAVVAALAIGLVFGWFLERGGLGNARKLAGQFYLRDLTVFKVLFSALVTAMLGVFWLGRAGVLEPRLLQVPSTFLAPMAVGGIVFGVGFVLGGLCPGTSCVSASSGRIDGLLVMVGMFAGVLGFMELHPLLEAFHNSTGRGLSTLPSLLGASPGTVVAAVTVAALLAFAAAERLDVTPSPHRARPALVVGGLAMAIGAVLPTGSEAPWPGTGHPGGAVTPVELARAIREGDLPTRVLDVRPPDAFQAFHLPLAESVPFEDLGRFDLDGRGDRGAGNRGPGHRPGSPGLRAGSGERVVVYGFGTEDGERARVLLERRGLGGVEVLEGGAVAFLRQVMAPLRPRDLTPEQRRRFQETAELARYFGGAPRRSATGGPDELDLDAILGQARRAACGW